MSIPRIPRKIPSGPDVDRFLEPSEPATAGDPADPAPSPATAEAARRRTPAAKTRRASATREPDAPPTAADGDQSPAGEGKRGGTTRAGSERTEPVQAEPARARARSTAAKTGRGRKAAAETDWRELLGGPSVATSIRVPIELQNKLRDAAHYLEGWDMTRILVEGAARLVVELDRAAGGIPERPQLRKVELD